MGTLPTSRAKKQKTHFESLLGEMRTRQEKKHRLYVCVVGQERNAWNKGKDKNKKEQSQEQ